MAEAREALPRQVAGFVSVRGVGLSDGAQLVKLVQA
jgi:hypothetical protein